MKTLSPSKWLAIGGVTIAALAFFIGSAMHPAPAPKAEAAIPPEALQLGAGIAANIEQFKNGQDMVNTGNSLMQKAMLSARGKDMQLCADFHLSYSRTSKQLVDNQNCAQDTAAVTTDSTQASF